MLIHRNEKSISDPAVIGRVLISRRDYVLCSRLELAKPGKVLFDVDEDGISLACRQAILGTFQACGFDVDHLNENRTDFPFYVNSAESRDWNVSVRGDELHGHHLGRIAWSLDDAMQACPKCSRTKGMKVTSRAKAAAVMETRTPLIGPWT